MGGEGGDDGLGEALSHLNGLGSDSGLGAGARVDIRRGGTINGERSPIVGIIVRVSPHIIAVGNSVEIVRIAGNLDVICVGSGAYKLHRHTAFRAAHGIIIAIAEIVVITAIVAVENDAAVACTSCVPLLG